MHTKNIHYHASPIMTELYTNRNTIYKFREHREPTTATSHTLKYNTLNTLHISTK